MSLSVSLSQAPLSMATLQRAARGPHCGRVLQKTLKFYRHYVRIRTVSSYINLLAVTRPWVA
jgi:hypothetical protein